MYTFEIPLSSVKEICSDGISSTITLIDGTTLFTCDNSDNSPYHSYMVISYNDNKNLMTLTVTIELK